ncbi:hypothetical protein [Halomicrobium katesii]|uniref:hypothetical protein n=1 Tax=Halomicrobium katesii TaxID=437163 RepID=UPI0012BA8CD9|nr:hypothetical protein [Halomicrobium katesii]
MRYWPLWKNPGLSRIAQSLRDYFISHIKQIFRVAPDDVQRRVVSAILVSDSHATHDSEEPLPVTAVNEQNILVDENALSLRCRAEARPFETPANLPAIQVKDGVAKIPRSIWERKLETYARIGWAKLTHAYYQIVDSRLLAYCVQEGERVRNEIVKYLETRHDEELYGTCYGANSPTEYKDSSTLLDSGIVPSKRLANIVDAVRAHPEGSFDEYHTPDQLFAMVCDILPAPHRPSTALSTANAVQDVLERSYGSAVCDRKTTDRCRTGGAEVEYKIEQPEYTPLYRPQEDQLHLWAAYERVLEKQRKYRYDSASEDHPYSVAGSLGTQDIEGTTTSDAAMISQAQDQAHRAAVCEPLAVDSPSDVPIHAQPDEFPECSADEIEFLTRIAYAMTGFIDGYSLTEPMSRLTDGSERQLSVDLDKLENRGHVALFRRSTNRLLRRMLREQIDTMRHSGQILDQPQRPVTRRLRSV